MEFFEKVNELAKAAADKTAEVVEDTRLKAQILNDEKSIRELEAKIGAWYYEQFPQVFLYLRKSANGVPPSLSIRQISKRKKRR